MDIDIGQAIKAINENAEYRIEGSDWDTLEWLNSTAPISQADIETKQAELQAIEDAKPSLEDLKASAKAKLIAGEALTEEEANTIVL
jgi:hypothetical protein